MEQQELEGSACDQKPINLQEGNPRILDHHTFTLWMEQSWFMLCEPGKRSKNRGYTIATRARKGHLNRPDTSTMLGTWESPKRREPQGSRALK